MVESNMNSHQSQKQKAAIMGYNRNHNNDKIPDTKTMSNMANIKISEKLILVFERLNCNVIINGNKNDVINADSVRNLK